MTQDIKNLEQLIDLVKNSETIKFRAKIVANSKNNSIDFEDEYIKIKIKQRAIEGKANKAIVEFLSELLKCSKSKIKIIIGEKSSLKTIQIN